MCTANLFSKNIMIISEKGKKLDFLEDLQVTILRYQNQESLLIVKKPRPADNLKKYKIKHIPKNRDILENSKYESKQEEYMRL